MSDDVVDGEFIDARPVKPTAWKCHCPACRVMIGDGNYCDDCLKECVQDMIRNHSARKNPRDHARDAKAIVEGMKAGARVVDGFADLVSTVTGKPRRRRLR